VSGIRLRRQREISLIPLEGPIRFFDEWHASSALGREESLRGTGASPRTEADQINGPPLKTLTCERELDPAIHQQHLSISADARTRLA